MNLIAKLKAFRNLALILIVLLSFNFVNNAYCQTFAVPIGAAGSDEGASTIVKGLSGDYFIGGYHENKGLLCRVTPEGDIVWSKSIDCGADPDYVMELELSSDGFIIGCGNSRAGSSNLYGFAFKVSPSGDLIWNKQISADDDYIWVRGIMEAENGNYRVFGGCKQTTLNSFVVEFDNTDGDQLWDTVYAKDALFNGWDEDFYDGLTHTTNNASYFLGRFETGSGFGSYRPSLTKLSEAGDFEWSKTYLYNSSSSGGRYYGTGIAQDNDSLIMTLLCKDGGSSPPFETGIIKTDLEGNLGWAKLYSSPGVDLRSFSSTVASDGYIISGWEETGDKSLFIIKTDFDGTVVWAKTYGSGDDEDVKIANNNAQIIVDGGTILMVGRTASYTGSNDAYLIKVDLMTGELLTGACYNDLTIVTEALPAVEFDYSCETFKLPMTSPDIAMPMVDLDFEWNEGILDFVADTLVSGGTIYLCSDEPFELFANWSPTLNFLWNTGGTDPLESVSESGTYYVDVSSGDGCLLWSDTVSIIFNALNVDLGDDLLICDDLESMLDPGFFAGATYEWNDGSTDQTLLVESAGEYWVNIISGDCEGADTVVIVFDTVELSLGPDAIICFEENIVLDAENTGATYEWSDGSSDQTLIADESGLYWVEINVDGCTRRDSMYLTVSDVRVDLVNDTILCQGESILLDAGAVAGSYLWNDGSTDQTILVTSDGTYSVTVSDDDCSHSDEVEVQFFEPFANFEGEPLSGCVPLTVHFYDLSTTSLGFINNWYWTFGDGDISLIENPSHTYTTAGEFDVALIINTNLGCGDDTLMMSYVVTSEAVSADFTFSPDFPTAEDLVSFTSSSTNATSWYWDFGDGTFSNEENPAHQFNGTGEFTVTLTAMNESGCNETIVKQITVRDAVYIYVPNAFTPDGDDYNEGWKPIIYGIDIYDYHLIVFNRWGEIIWESYDPNVGWDGFYGNYLVQDGVYIWVMDYGDRFDDERHQMEGHVVVLK